MRWLFVGVLVIHGLIHALGVVEGFRLADVPQLAEPISTGHAVLWLLAGAGLLATAGLVAAGNASWWLSGLVSVALSQSAILTSWSDARYGTLLNLIVLVGVVYGLALEGPWSFQARYRREVRTHVRRAAASEPAALTESDTAHLPAAVRRYLSVAGALGRPRVTHLRATWRGRIRAVATDPWMPFTADQYDILDEPSRFFHMAARRGGLPVDILHVYAGEDASMQVRLLSLIPLVDLSGEELRRTETVTVFNDLCLLAPGALADPAIEWEELDERRVRASFTSGRHTIEATLVFDDDGYLVDFISDDRLAVSADGEHEAWRWSTPVSDYETYGRSHVASRGSGVWHAPGGAYSYIELELLDLELNGPAP